MRSFCYGVTAVALAVLVVTNIWQTAWRVLYSELVFAYPQVLYEPMPVPGTAIDAASPGVAGADFSQVYTSALALRHGESAYLPTSPAYADRFHRTPGYPPLTNWIYLPLSFLPYPAALVAHEVGSMLLFLATAAGLLWAMGLIRLVGPMALALGSLLFLSPVGLTFMERGQFDLLVATAMLLCVSCVWLPRGQVPLTLAAGLLGAMKWTALPFLGGFAGIAFLHDQRPRHWAYLLVPVTMVVATVSFGRALLEFWRVIVEFELTPAPVGLTLQHFLPHWPAKVVAPAVVAGLAGLLYVAGPRAARPQLLRAICLPAALTLVLLTLLFGTMSFEYHSVTLLGMIPVLIVWLMRAEHVGAWTQGLATAAYGLLLCLAMRVLCPPTLVNSRDMTLICAGAALFFLIQCVHIAFTHPASYRGQRALAAAVPGRQSSPAP